MKRSTTFISAVCVLFVSSFVEAESTTWIATGIVERVDNPLATTFSNGDAFRLEFSFETTTEDTDPFDSSRGRYPAITEASVLVGSYGATATAGNILVFNGLGGSLLDVYSVNPVGWSGPDVAGLALDFPALELRDSTGDAFSDISLPRIPVDLSKFSNRSMSLTFRSNDGGPDSLLVASVDSLSVKPTPATDSDVDGALDTEDNCIEVANGPDLTDLGGNSQLDTDGDGFGNYCDADFNNDGIVNFADLAALKAAFGTLDANIDMDGSGFVNFRDLALFKSGFGKPPGPSGIAPRPEALELQVDPVTIATLDQSALTAIVTDVNGNPVKGQIIDFSILRDPTGGELSPLDALTDKHGRATVVYTAGDTPSSQDGVELKATVRGAGISQVETLTVAQLELFLSLGKSFALLEPNDAQFRKEWVVQATDSGGDPVSDVDIQVSINSVRWFQGCYLVDNGIWSRIVTAACNDEDTDRDGILDSSPTSEDTNMNGRIEAGNVALVATPSSGAGQTVNVTTDWTGSARFDVLYPQSYHGWVEVEIEAVLSIAGTESRRTELFILDAQAEDIENINAAPPGMLSPFGRQIDSSAPFCVTAPEDPQPSCPSLPGPL